MSGTRSIAKLALSLILATVIGCSSPPAGPAGGSGGTTGSGGAAGRAMEDAGSTPEDRPATMNDAGMNGDVPVTDAGNRADTANLDARATDTATSDTGVRDAGATDTGPAGPPNLYATGSGLVEVFVNGTSLGKTTSNRALLSVAATIVTGENEIVVRPGNGGAATPFTHLQVGGAYGKAGTSNRWKAKAAAGTEATDANGPWTALAFDDSAWAAATDVNVAPAAPFPTDGPAHGVWTAAATDGTVLLRLKLYIPANLVAATPRGFGSGVTGGQGGAVVTVTTTAQLVAAVADNTARIIQVSGTLDFTGTEGPITSASCFVNQCPDGTFEYITAALGACTSSGMATFNVTYDKAGTTPLAIGSNKTIIGLGANATIKGKGLRMVNGVSNIIIRNLTITNINPQIVWGGDSLTIDDASNIWIDHVRVSLAGRQFLVTGFGQASNVTVSWTEFDGRTQWSATCNGAHYWLMLFAQSSGNMTLANNWIHNTSGRGPHSGGLTTTFDTVQFANDLYETVPGHAADPAEGSTLLYEGTVFNQVTTPVVVEATMAGVIYVPLASTVASTNAACTAALGRNCVANSVTPQTGSFPLDQAVLTTFSSQRAGLVTPYAASEVVNVVPHLAGPGHI